MENDILTASQSGFMKRDSAVNQLINIANDFGKALDSGKEVRVVFCDISKAFDRAWHKGLIYKLKTIRHFRQFTQEVSKVSPWERTKGGY